MLEDEAKDDITDLDKGIVGAPDWARRWRVGQTAFHRDTPYPFLLENGPTIFGGGKKRIFVPLCGKTPDLTWLYENGHEVVGVEIVEQPVIEYFAENAIEHTIEDIHEEVGKIYKSADGRLTILRGSLFSIPLRSVHVCVTRQRLPFDADFTENAREQYGKFDAIWDVQSFTALNLDDRIRYRDLLYSVMKPGAVSYMKTLEYDDAVWPGPPHSTSDAVVSEIFGDGCEIELLEEVDLKKAKPSPQTDENQRQGDAEASTSTSTATDSTEGPSDQKKEDQTKDSANEQSKTDEAEKPISAARAAISKSSFRFDRWYKLQLK